MKQHKMKEKTQPKLDVFDVMRDMHGLLANQQEEILTPNDNYFSHILIS